MWVKVYDAGSPVQGGRLNLDNAAALIVSGSGTLWVVNARLADGVTNVKVAGDLTSKEAAEAWVDNVILNGS
jgi:hypothetical protein